MQRDAINRVDLAFNGFYRRARLGKQPGYPRFKSASRYDSFTVQIRDFSLRGDALRLSKVGEFRVKTRCKVKGSPVSVTIRRADGKWLAILACDIGEAPPKAPVSRAIGIDVGVTALATLSDGREIANPRWADRQAKAIAWEDDDEKLGVQKVTITALTEQAAIDIEAELPRIKKLLERDWIKEIAE
jgi:putative transposase